LKRCLLLLALPMLLGAEKCPVPTPSPSPSPTATPTPAPTPTPTPAPECLPGVPWCNELTPPAQCSTPSVPCKHNPTSDPAHCQLAPACPTPAPTPTPTPTPPPGPTPTPGPYPIRFPLPTATLAIRVSAYGQGFDSTLYVVGDSDLCNQIHGVAVNKCHFESDVWSGPNQRASYEMAVMGGARVGIAGVGPRCPVWQYTSGSATIYPCHDDQDALASCDHFGRPQVIDDPKTPTTGETLETLQGFEGEPKECGLMRDAFGPYAGFFTIAHGKGSIRNCLPLDTATCSTTLEFDH
jgi:hypothetical protein